MADPQHPGHVDPLRSIGLLFGFNPESIKRGLATQLTEAGGLSALWQTTRWPFAMLIVLDASLGDRAAATHIVLDAIDLTVEREPFADAARALAQLEPEGDLWSIAADFWRLSTEHCSQLAKAIRAIAPPPPTIDELLEHVLRTDQEQLARRPVIGFTEVFERSVLAPVPFSIPPDVVTVSTVESKDNVRTTMIGSAAARDDAILVQVQRGAIDHLPLGYFMAGFWGHGVNSYSFYYATVTDRQRVYLRIAFGGAYGDIVQERAAVLAAFEHLARIPHDTQFTLCGTYEGYVRRTRDDGTIVERPLRGIDWDVIHEVLGS